MEVPTVVIHGKVRELSAPDFTDAQIASGVFMHTSPTYAGVMRTLKAPHGSIEGIIGALPSVARDRILYLSQRLERAEALIEMMQGAAESEMGELEDVRKFLAEPKTKPSLTENLYERP